MMDAIANKDVEIGRLLEHVFRTIQQSRMQDVPILNTALQVEAVNFHAWQSEWLGIMITPWFMNLMLLPQSDNWMDLPEGSKQIHQFPSGNYEFVVGVEKEIGKYQACSLFSLVFQFEDHASAVATARACLDALMRTEGREVLGSEPMVEDEQRGFNARESISRRDFLRGGFLRSQRGGLNES